MLLGLGEASQILLLLLHRMIDCIAIYLNSVDVDNILIITRQFYSNQRQRRYCPPPHPLALAVCMEISALQEYFIMGTILLLLLHPIQSTIIARASHPSIVPAWHVET